MQLNTGLGKSLVIYMLVRYLQNIGDILVIVPSVNLVTQLYNDFKDYGYVEIEDNVSMVYSGSVGNKKIGYMGW